MASGVPHWDRVLQCLRLCGLRDAVWPVCPSGWAAATGGSSSLFLQVEELRLPRGPPALLLSLPRGTGCPLPSGDQVWAQWPLGLCSQPRPLWLLLYFWPVEIFVLFWCIIVEINFKNHLCTEWEGRSLHKLTVILPSFLRVLIYVV